jgi:decaprenylphospho-beta-D-erythro-pentofuranosid-2-ulose 2-reductase
VSGPERILVAGATSGIAVEALRLFAAEGASLFLIARNETRLAAVADDLRVRGAKVITRVADLDDMARHPQLVESARTELGGLDVLLIAHGVLSDQKSCEASVEDTLAAMTTNFLSAVSLLTLTANFFEGQRRGCLAVLSSVAGDRGRQSNYVYGTTKGALNVFLQGLRNRLNPFGVSVVTIKPGFVSTQMTAHLPKNALFASAADVGKAVHAAIRRERDVVYTPWFWRPIMWVIRSIPEFIFKRLSL